MTRQPVASRNAARASTSARPISSDVRPGATAGASARHVDQSTSFAPMRRRPGPRSLKRAMSGALSPVKKPFVRFVFSKLKPTKPGPMRPRSRADHRDRDGDRGTRGRQERRSDRRRGAVRTALDGRRRSCRGDPAAGGERREGGDGERELPGKRHDDPVRGEIIAGARCGSRGRRPSGTPRGRRAPTWETWLGLAQALGDLDDAALDAAEHAGRREAPPASRSPAGRPVRISIPCETSSTA